MNTVDPTGSIIFTREDEKKGRWQCEVYSVQEEDAHTDQYLNFASHHPKHQKLGVVRALMNRCETITSDEGDKKEEVEHLRGSLRVCGYPSWALNKVTDSRRRKRTTKKQMTEIAGAK